jgi:3-isopropylmalate dehydrogenase
LAGDGIGPEVTNEAKKVLNALAGKFGHTFVFDHQLMGGCAIDAVWLQPARRHGGCVQTGRRRAAGRGGRTKVGQPQRTKDRPERGLLALRKALNLFANLRPVKLHHN